MRFNPPHAPAAARAAVLALTLLSLVPASAQTVPDPGAPSAPELRLPDMAEEARAVAPQDVEAPLPPAAVLPAPTEAPPLPAERELAIPESAYRTEASLASGPADGAGATFTEASVGAGLWDGVSASLSIYRPGSDPSFGLTFSHEALDGIAFHEAGTGFYERRTALSGRVRGSATSAGAWGGSAGFSDEGYGLQGLSADFSGVSYRRFDAKGDIRRSFGSLWGGDLSASLEADGLYVSRVLEIRGSDPSGIAGVDEASASPEASLSWRFGKLELSLGGSYDFRGILGLDSDDESDRRYSHRAGADLRADYEVSSFLDLGASVGFSSSTDIPVLVPFSLSAEAGLGSLASLSVAGGLRTETRLLSDAWKWNPYLDLGELPPDDARWYGEGAVDVFLAPGLTARVGGVWESSLGDGGRIAPVEPVGYDSAAGVYERGLYTYVIEDYRTFATSASLRWTRGGAGASVGWEADWLDEPAVGAVQRLKTQLEYRDPAEQYGAAATAAFGFGGDSGGAELPLLDASGFVRLSRELRMVVQIDDLLAAFEGKDGRTRWEPYLTSGFRASVRLQMSL